MAVQPVDVAGQQAGIDPAVRRVLKRNVLDLRKKVEDDFRRQLAALGITSSGVRAVPANRGLSAYEQRARAVAEAVFERETGAGGRSASEALDFFVEECAFTFINRAFGLRCLEERGLLLVDGRTETVLKIDPSRGSSSLYWQVRNSLVGADPQEVWRETFRKACEAVSQQVRILFDPDSESAALFPLAPTVQPLVDALNQPEVPSDTYATDELLGWVYQYFNAESKDEVFAAASKGKKIEGEDVIAATQIYTERYMVDFLLQNSLGRFWTELHPATALRNGWPYFLAPHPDNPNVERAPKPVRDVTVMDPAVGSGHFLLRAADLLFGMYEEEEPGLSRREIALNILERNLFGIDLDLRAVQIAALALYMKASSYAGEPVLPSRINVVAADVQLETEGPSAAYLKRFDGDREMEGLVRNIWQSLREVRELGSLIHPERAVEQVAAKRRARYPLEIQDDGHWDIWKRDLLSGLREEVEKHVKTDTNVANHLFGEQAIRGFGLVELLARQYDVVCANPPYMGSKNMGSTLKNFIQLHYAAFKRDLYAAFIMRCRELATSGGFVAMVAQQSWMFLRSYADVRDFIDNTATDETSDKSGILRATTIEAIAHLGPGAFQEVTGEVVNCALFVLRTVRPLATHKLTAVRLIGARTPALKRDTLVKAVAGKADGLVFNPSQKSFLAIKGSPLAYWLRDELVRIMSNDPKLSTIASVKQGLATGDDDRFLRYIWEIRKRDTRWFNYSKGGGYRKWWGLMNYLVDWENNGERIKGTGRGAVRNETFYMIAGLTHGQNTQGAMSVRVLPPQSVFGGKGPATHCLDASDPTALMVLMNSRFASYLLRAATCGMDFTEGYVSALPLPGHNVPSIWKDLAQTAIDIKKRLLANDPLEGSFETSLTADDGNTDIERSIAVLLEVEAACEASVVNAFQLSNDAVAEVTQETEKPSGWLPLLKDYDAFPDASGDPPLPQEVQRHYAALPRRTLSSIELATVKNSLRRAYESVLEAQPLPTATEEDPGVEADDDDTDVAFGAFTKPFPNEYLLEQLSQQFEIHPVSIYWLLRQLKEEHGVACPPQRKRSSEDRLSVALLRILGYRWPMQDQHETERGAPFLDPKFADADGIIPLTPGAGQRSVADRIREVLRDQFPGHDAEGEMCSPLGWKPGDEWGKQQPMSLERWFEREFFKHHVQQFKQRPIAWHFTSPEGNFQAFVLYHRLSRATLAKLRTVYAGATIERLRADQEKAKSAGRADEFDRLQRRIDDVDEFRQRIEKIERGDELKYRIRCRWEGEEATGRPGPYSPDIDDGVKVNIRPFQEAGVLAATVIRKW